MSDNIKLVIVKYILDYLEHNLDYLIMRNYESLPEDEGHDIDILIRSEDMHLAQKLIEELKSQFNVEIYLRDEYFGLCSYCALIHDTILHVDFFTGMYWNRTPLIPTEELLARKQRFKGGLWVINDTDLAYYCWVQYVRGEGAVKEKYVRNAHTWEEHLLREEAVDIRALTYAEKKKILRKRVFGKETATRRAYNKLCTICSRLGKIFHMDGRIYVSDDLTNPVIAAGRLFCSCSRKDIADTDSFGYIQCLRALFRECSVGISSAKWESLWWRRLIPSSYVFKNPDNLHVVLHNIFNGKQC